MCCFRGFPRPHSSISRTTSHRGDIDEAGFLLEAAFDCFPPGTVHLAVVDPGVGSDRRILAIRVRDSWIVAPDNGLAGTFCAVGEPRSVDRPDLYRTAPGQTFHGRDRFAPVAAFLLAGGEGSELGSVVTDGVVAAVRPPRREDGVLRGRIRHIDRFGNAVSDIPSTWVDGALEGAWVDGYEVARFVSHYAEIAPGEDAVLPGSLGTLELSRRDGDLASAAPIRRGSELRIVLPKRPRDRDG